MVASSPPAAREEEEPSSAKRGFTDTSKVGAKAAVPIFEPLPIDTRDTTLLLEEEEEDWESDALPLFDLFAAFVAAEDDGE